MSAEPDFIRLGSSGLYWLNSTSHDPPLAGFWAGESSPVHTRTLTDTWALSAGTYVFLGSAANGLDAFATALAEYLASLPPSAVPRWLWIANPRDPVPAWSTTAAYAVPGTEAGSWVMARRVDFVFDSYTLVVRGGGAVAAANADGAGWGFTVADPGVPAASLLTPAAAMDARTGTTLLSMDPATAGCWRCALDVPAPGTGPDAFARLDCGIRYFMPAPDGTVLSVPLAVLRQPPDTALSFYGTLDPLRPLTGSRSNLGLLPWGSSAGGTTLYTGFSTARGYPVNLTPQPGGVAGVPPARLVFAFAPWDAGPAGAASPAVPGAWYLSPEGLFSVDVVEPEPGPGGAAVGSLEERAPGAGMAAIGSMNRLLCGMSGLEYLGLPSSGTSGLVFVAGRPAYAPMEATATGADALSSLGTTSWVFPQGPPDLSIRYYAQPEDAPLFGGPVAAGKEGLGAEDTIGFLDFLEVAAATLPDADERRAFPMAPYRGLHPSLLNAARILEQRALAPCRRAVLAALTGTGGWGPAAAAGFAPRSAGDAAVPEARAELAWSAVADGEAAQVGVTPQGLAVGVNAEDATWSWVGIGQAGPGPVSRPDLRFTVCNGTFRQAMLTNNLFMVLGNADEFGRYGSVAYQLTAAEVRIIAGSPAGAKWPRELFDDVNRYFGGAGWPSYATRALFDQALTSAYPEMKDEQKLVFRRAAGQLTPVVQDWAFRLGPDSWSNPDRQGQTNAYLLFKFVLGRSLADLAADLSTWAWPAAASPDGDPATAQRNILGIIAAAVPSGGVPPSPPYRNFARVVTDPDWTGVIALSASVPLDSLPGPLQVLAAGIDPNAFYAHHVGMSVTPYQVSGGQLLFDRSSLFGLIDYQNPEDQYFSSDIAFAFRVMQLTVGIQNSAVSSFASRAQLLVNRLFGAPTRLLPSNHGNNVMLEGAYQQQRQANGSLTDAYVFAAPTANTFQSGQPVLNSVELLSVQLVTATPANPGQGGETVRATFRMSGNLRFYEPAKFDPFCWGPRDDGTDGWLRFGNLALGMTFSLADPGTPTFTLDDGDLSFDFANSVARPNSLAGRFPVRLGRLVATPDPVVSPPPSPAPPPTTPESLGFVSVSVPLDQSVMEQPWYGLVYTVDLGTLGALAGSAGISLQVMAGWSPEPRQEGPAVYVGVRLPGTRDTFGVSLPLQGILRLGFRSIEFLVSEPEGGGPRSYTLRLRDFALRLLGLSFPPGHNDVYLFGNPDQGSASKLGWYAAYAAGADAKKQTAAPGRRALQATRPTLRLAPGEDP